VASAIDAIMGILPQALFCGFNNGYCHGYSLFLKPYFAASTMDTIMSIHTSSNLIWHCCSSSPCLSCICNLSCNKRTGEEGLHKVTPTIDRELMKSVGACHSSSSQLLVMNVKFTSDNLWATLIRLCLLHSLPCLPSNCLLLWWRFLCNFIDMK
jgi:hypothetical protein